MKTIPCCRLSNGVDIPVLGLGVYKTTDPEDMRNAVSAAIEAGYRLFDTARMYENEALLGECLEASGLKRSELFINSKLHMDDMGYDRAIKAFEQSLKDLKTDYLDMFMIHWPGQQKERLLDTWRALEDLYLDGRIKALGMSNFLIKHIDWILESCRVRPVLDQKEHNPRFSEPELYEYCEKNGIKVQAWSPLMRGAFDDPVIMGLSEKYGRTPAQIILRWQLDEGFLVIPKSVRRERIFENADVFGFSLKEEELRAIDGLNIRKSTSMTRDPLTFDF